MRSEARTKKGMGMGGGGKGRQHVAATTARMLIGQDKPYEDGGRVQENQVDATQAREKRTREREREENMGTA